MVRKLIEKLLGDPNEKALKKLRPLVTKINQIEEEYQKTLTSDEDFPKKTQEFKDRLAAGETLDNLLPEAFALVKSACRRLYGREFIIDKLYGEEETEGADANKYTWKMIPFDVQLIGGMILHQGKISEMKTGEGKTLVSTLPLYLNALAGKGVFLVTVNEYLAQRDAGWMGILYKFLGLSVAVNLHAMSQSAKKAAYQSDIIYGTNSEFGFDYLRDNMATNIDNIVQRELNYAIIDEVDSILIDEARTPLIISAPAAESTDKYMRYAGYVRQLTEKEDFEIDEKQRSAVLTEAGIQKMEKIMGVDNIYTDAGFDEVHHIEQALKANYIFKNEVDYVVKEGEIIIVDEFTGRLMPGRRYSDGLHQSIEAKERVEVKRESRTLATVTLQNYFRLFKKLGGMTGTAKTEEEEFYQIYGLETIVVPTNKTVSRDDKPDMVFKNWKGKYSAVVKRVKEANDQGQPVLIGTVSIEKSEHLSRELQKAGVSHSVLNAKYHEKEAEIVAQAGAKGAVTIATNMAGRGTDIKIDEEVKAVGGLLVIGTERHESRRIDNQLRGRSGRQGDPGESQFFVSMDDELMRLFSGDRIMNMMESLKFPEDMPIQNSIITNSIESAQKKVEGRNFDVRKHLVEYDDVMNKHREIIYSRRRKILFNENIKNEIIILVEKEAERIVLKNASTEERGFDCAQIIEDLSVYDPAAKTNLSLEQLQDLVDQEALIEHIKTYLFELYGNKEAKLTSPEVMRQLEKNVYLSVIDTHWMEHIDSMQTLRESVSLRGYGQRDPLIEYKEQAFLMFKQMLSNIQTNTINTLYRINLEAQIPAHLLKVESQLDQAYTNESSLENNLQNTSLHVTAKPVSKSSSWAVEQPEEGLRVVRHSTSSDSSQSAENSGNQLACDNLGRNDICPKCGVKAKKCPYKK
ncbi:preprotein translocase subunit SecA [Candidatus Peregrinibacteria bacterium]|nr:preprotein translocase subunit SecA [Candidatus Peregrinibacteria bacterium]